MAKSGAVVSWVIGFPYIVSAAAVGREGRVAASERITMGAIGVGGRGTRVLRSFLQLRDAQVVAVCDVNRSRREAVQRLVNEHYGGQVCSAYHDFRELLARSDIDAVLIATPVFWHVPIAVRAAQAGRDMYMEKPVGLSLEEAKILRQAIGRYGRVFQFGTQQRSDGKFRFACELVRNGRIGRVHTIEVGVPSGDFSKRFEYQRVPEELDYEMWLGPAPWSPYTDAMMNGQHHERMSLYSLGFIAAWGIHHLDIAQWGNGTELSGPESVEGTAIFPDKGVCYCAMRWEVTLKYANGVTMQFTDNQKNRQGVRFIGENGWVYVNRGQLTASAAWLLREQIGPGEIHLPVSNNHSENFLACVRSRGRTAAPVDVAVRSETLCQLSDIATRTGRRLRWDPIREECVGDHAARQYLSLRPMRSPWHL